MLKLKSWQLGALVLAVLFGGVLVTSAFGWWQTESSKEPLRYEIGEAAGEYNPADIRGSYTFAEISALFEIPYGDLALAFHLPADADPATIACKDLEGMYTDLAEPGIEIGTASVRLFVALYKGLPYALDEETYLLRPAVHLLKRSAALSEEQVAYLDAHAVDLPGSAEASSAAEPLAETPEQNLSEAQPISTSVPASEDHVEDSERLIKGKTTFRELLDWGVSQETIEQIIGAAMPNPLTVIKDYCVEQGVEFVGIKTALQAEVDAAGE